MSKTAPPPGADPDAQRLPDAEFRRAFHAQRLALSREHGVETFDQAELLYRCPACEAPVVVRDAFYGREAQGPVEAFQAELCGRYYPGRAVLRHHICKKCGEVADLRAGRLLYAHFLPEVGFDVIFDVEPVLPRAEAVEPALQAEAPRAAVVGVWRMDARGKATRLPPPRSETDFRDQTGTFFDLRAGWRSVAATFRAARSRTGPRGAEAPPTVVAEVQSGYLIGARQGVPGDPAPEERSDPHLEHLFSAHERRTYDVLEFLGRVDPQAAPFHGELFDEWLPPEVAAEVTAGSLELFVLADSSEFLACIEDFCAHRGVAVEWIDPDEDLRVAFHLKSVRLEAAFAYPFLRSLHTGRTFHAGARLLYAPIVSALEDAADILEIVESSVGGHAVDVIDGTLMRIRTPEGAEVGRWNLMTIAGRLGFRSQEGQAALFRLLGYDPEARAFRPRPQSLEQCPLCGEAARVGKVIRPTRLSGLDPATLVGVALGEQFVFYTQECALHSTPVAPGPGRTLQALEARWAEGLAEARLVLVDARTERLSESETLTLLVGFEVGSLVLEPERLRSALEAADGPVSGKVSAYAFFPDALVVTSAPLDAAGRRAARIRALEAVQPRFPARIWPLDVARAVLLPAEGKGVVERPS